MSPDTWPLTPDNWPMTPDMWQVVGDKHYFKTLALYLNMRFVFLIAYSLLFFQSTTKSALLSQILLGWSSAYIWRRDGK
jgi:hypothetical protein